MLREAHGHDLRLIDREHLLRHCQEPLVQDAIQPGLPASSPPMPAVGACVIPGG
jgi:hypothetical protein